MIIWITAWKSWYRGQHYVVSRLWGYHVAVNEGLIPYYIFYSYLSARYNPQSQKLKTSMTCAVQWVEIATEFHTLKSGQLVLSIIIGSNGIYHILCAEKRHLFSSSPLLNSQCKTEKTALSRKISEKTAPLHWLIASSFDLNNDGIVRARPLKRSRK